MPEDRGTGSDGYPLLWIILGGLVVVAAVLVLLLFGDHGHGWWDHHW